MTDDFPWHVVAVRGDLTIAKFTNEQVAKDFVNWRNEGYTAWKVVHRP